MKISQELRDKISSKVEEYRKDPVNKPAIFYLGRLADHLRLRVGMNHRQAHEIIASVTPIHISEWDAILYEYDGMEELEI